MLESDGHCLRIRSNMWQMEMVCERRWLCAAEGDKGRASRWLRGPPRGVGCDRRGAHAVVACPPPQHEVCIGRHQTRAGCSCYQAGTADMEVSPRHCHCNCFVDSSSLALGALQCACLLSSSLIHCTPEIVTAPLRCQGVRWRSAFTMISIWSHLKSFQREAL